jgi:hypothetical protein
MAKTSSLLLQYARMGAVTRLTELRAEIEALKRAFPDLAGRRGPGRRVTPPSATGYTDDGQTAGPGETVSRKRRQRKPMTAAQRKAVGERMRKYWAARRKATKQAAR